MNYKNASIWAIVAMMLVLTACSGPAQKADQLAARQDWMRAVMEYRRAQQKRPTDVEIRSKLKQAELKAADHYYQRGLRAYDQGNLDGAIVEFQQGLMAMPQHAKLTQAMQAAISRKEASENFKEGMRLKAIGKLDEAKRHLHKALKIYPRFHEASKALDEIEAAERTADSAKLVLSSKSPITLNFRNTNLRTAFGFVAKSFGVNVIFDQSVADTPVTLYARNVTFEQALNLMLTTTKTFYKRVGPNTILVIPDTAAKRGQYEDYIIRTFHLNNINAKDMLAVLRGVMTIKKATINKELNTITIRDTDEVLQLVERMISLNDRKPAEIVVDVEILEVNRTKAEVLGLDWGSKITTKTDPVSAAIASLPAAIANTTITLPGLTFNYFKQDVDAKILANPKVRVLHGKEAKIHIGDRVPLRASTTVDATGQVRTTYDYKDIGIRLVVTPVVHLDNSVLVKINLEVSTLGANVGTESEPAYSIGTRNAETFMILRDGETAILGGLIRDEDRNNHIRVPGVGDIPIAGRLFGTKDRGKARTDVLLTITPRVVRAWDVPPKNTRQIFSGTENAYSTAPMFAYMDKRAGDKNPRIVLDQKRSTSDTQTPGAQTGGVVPPASVPILSFSQPVYRSKIGQEIEVVLLGRNMKGVKSAPVEVLFNTQLLQYVRASAGGAVTSTFNAGMDEAHGRLQLKIDFGAAGAPDGEIELARLVIQSQKGGISYLVYRAPIFATINGGNLNAQVRASRVLIAR